MRAWVARVGHAANGEQVGREPQHIQDGVALGWGNNEDGEGGATAARGLLQMGGMAQVLLWVAAKHNMVGSAEVAKMAAKLAKSPTRLE